MINCTKHDIPLMREFGVVGTGPQITLDDGSLVRQLWKLMWADDENGVRTLFEGIWTTQIASVLPDVELIRIQLSFSRVVDAPFIRLALMNNVNNIQTFHSIRPHLFMHLNWLPRLISTLKREMSQSYDN